MELLKSQMYAERAAKRERRPQRARAMPEETAAPKGQNTSLQLLLLFTKTITSTQNLGIKMVLDVNVSI